MIDGKEVDIANWLVEPPGLYMGRGAHPIRGSWKPRVEQKDVTLNLDESTPVPKGDWSVVHDHESIWIAKWIDKLTDREKYVWPHESSEIQQSRNKEKYDKALRIGGPARSAASEHPEDHGLEGRQEAEDRHGELPDRQARDEGGR